MSADHKEDVEVIQRVAARTIATHPAGRNLVLIGGFRYRFLDESVRASDDIDYHWAGDLEQKQLELVDLLSRVLLPEIRRRFRYEGSVNPHIGPDSESPAVRTVDLAFWQQAVPYSRIEIPIELTRIVCADPITVRTAGGTIYPTVSDADMVESKVIAVFNRRELQHRDLVDLFLFQNRLLSDSGQRLAVKLRSLNMSDAKVRERMADLGKYAEYHAKAVQLIIDAQLDPPSGGQINDAGGGRMIFDACLALLNRLILPGMGVSK